jgi:hypothetical protein
MTPNAESNLIAAQIAFLTFEVPQIYVMVDKRITEGMSTILTDIGAKDMCAFPVDIEEWDYLVSHGKAEVVEERIEKQTTLGAFVEDPESAELLPLLVQRKDETTFPCSAVKLEAGDVVLALERVPATSDTVG